MSRITTAQRITLACWPLASVIRGVFIARAIVANDRTASRVADVSNRTNSKEPDSADLYFTLHSHIAATIWLSRTSCVENPGAK